MRVYGGLVSYNWIHGTLQCLVHDDKWAAYAKKLNTLDPQDLKVAKAVKVSFAIANLKAQGRDSRGNKKNTAEKLRILNRFYLALMLRDLVQESTVPEVYVFDITPPYPSLEYRSRGPMR